MSSYIVNATMIKNEEKTAEPEKEPIQERCIKELLEEDELMQLSKQDLQYLVNNIYAIHGQYFDKDSAVYSYFIEFEWYRNIPKKNVTYGDLDEIQRKNVDLLVRVMKAKGYRE